MHATRIDRKKRLAAEPHSGHNRYHPDIAPVLEVAEGEEVVLETRDSVDGQVGPDMSAADLAHLETGLVHPLTGPVFLKGAEPGDMLEVEFLDIVPQPTAFSVIIPGMGFLRDIMTRPFVVHWKIRDGWATSASARLSEADRSGRIPEDHRRPWPPVLIRASMAIARASSDDPRVLRFPQPIPTRDATN